MFNWETFEVSEYSRDEEPSFVDLTTRSYITAEGHATQHTSDPAFLELAQAAATVAKTVSDGPEAGIPVSGFKAYRPYPVQAVWTQADQGEDFKIWIKQPLFIDETAFAAAISQADLDSSVAGQLKFEHLAEGIEVQTINHGPVTAGSPALQQLSQVIETNNYQRLHANQHREVYIDGLPLTADKVVLVRLAIDANGQALPEMVHN